MDNTSIIIISNSKLPKEFALIYNCANLFIYPSYYEGFGLPVLEAMTCGCPIIASKTSSIPEVLGDAGIMFNPNDVEELAVLIRRVLADEELSNTLTLNGISRSKDFSWKNCAKETVSVYNSLLDI